MLEESLRRAAVVAVLAFVLMACGSDDSATAAGGSTSVAVTTADPSDADAADDGAAQVDENAAATDDDDDDHDEHENEEDDHHDDHNDHDDEDDGHDDHDDDDGSSGGLGAHEHGVAELSVAWNDGEVIVDLISPTHNIFGFEHEPSTDEDRSLVEERTGALSQPGVIALNDEAGCELADGVDTELEFEGSHAELSASWLFECEHLDEIRQLDATALFAEFPNLEDIDAQWVSPEGQSAAELSPSSTVLSLG